ncbi:MAG: DUF3299 domain-containing protein [Betaproteobacteria bacterium]|nr:DUF3299 domain-containing protein [Betaproteobacteria bacterium]
MNANRLLVLAVAALCAGPAAALNTGVPGSGLPTATDYSSAILPERPGVVSWKTLSQVEPVKQGGKMVAEFGKDVLALDRKDVKVQGFMIPLDIGEKQKRFLISAVPPHCSFCLPVGPDAIVEVVAKTPVAYTFDPIVLSGRFAVVKNDPTGVLYRLADAIRVDAAAPALK